jgi:hypothetical protein
VRSSSNTSIGTPPGLSAVWSMSGGTAEISAALATRSVPWRPMWRATSPPPVEKPIRTTLRRSSAMISVARSSA